MLYVVRIVTQDGVEDLKAFSNLPDADRRFRAGWFWILKQERGSEALWDSARDSAFVRRIESFSTWIPSSATVADAICDRLLHRAHRIVLQGPSRRKEPTRS